MRRDLMDILACPSCKGPLDLEVEREEDSEIMAGTLHCRQCPAEYPIVDAIPNLLPPHLRD